MFPFGVERLKFNLVVRINWYFNSPMMRVIFTIFMTASCLVIRFLCYPMSGMSDTAFCLFLSSTLAYICVVVRNRCPSNFDTV